MKNEELLKVIGKIDDELIEEKQFAKKLPQRKTFRWQPIIKTAAVCACAFALVLGVTLPNLRMGASKKADTEAEYFAAPEEMAYDYVATEAEMPMTRVAGSGFEEDLAYTKLKENGFMEPVALPQKLTYYANLSLETENFDESYNALKDLVEANNGYFESSDNYNGSYYSNNINKSGYFCVRIPMASYDSFMNNIASSWHVSQKSENINDISDQYYDTQGRLDNLRIKQDRLQELLKSAQSMSDIIEIENSLSNVEYEIESLTGTLNRYDKQVDYATINIDLCQVTQIGDTVTSEGFGRRLVRALKNGFRNFSEGIADIIVWFGYNVIEIVLIIIAIVLIWRFKLIKKIIKWIKK